MKPENLEMARKGMAAGREWCGYFNSVRGKGNNRALKTVLQEIRDGLHKAEIMRLRALPPEEYEAEKKLLPAFMISATTRTGGHKEADLDAPTGLIQIDVDGLSGLPEAEAVRDRVFENCHIRDTWVSTGGCGVKAIIQVDADFARHRKAFQAVQAYVRDTLALTIDPQCSDPCRLCFASYDPGLKSRTRKETATLAFDAGNAPEEQPGGGGCTQHSTTWAKSYILHHSDREGGPLPGAQSATASSGSGFFAEYPAVKPIYMKVVGRNLGTVQPGTRNKAIVYMVPRLYSAVCPDFVLRIAEDFYIQHRGTFTDSVEQHLKETRHLLDACAADYQARQLSREEAAIYQSLTPLRQNAARICRSLAQCQSDECPLGNFYLSADHLGIRLDILCGQAGVILKDFRKTGILVEIERGQQRSAENPKPKGTLYRWPHPLSPAA